MRVHIPENTEPINVAASVLTVLSDVAHFKFRGNTVIFTLKRGTRGDLARAQTRGFRVEEMKWWQRK
ncbi:MAG TPA: hypothetical protein VJB95_02690 [Candidatus Paceibacterota bacterium]